MIEILLTLIIFALLGYHAWYTREVAKEKKQLVDAIIAKSALELRDLRIAENTKIKVDNKPGELPDMVSTDTLDDDQLLKAVKNTYGE